MPSNHEIILRILGELTSTAGGGWVRYADLRHALADQPPQLTAQLTPLLHQLQFFQAVHFSENCPENQAPEAIALGEAPKNPPPPASPQPVIAEEEPPKPDSPAAQPRKLRGFIVHGHDEALLKLLQKTLLPSATFDLISLGAKSYAEHVLDAFVKLADRCDFAIVLATADDQCTVHTRANQSSVEQRARQNVVFEWGFFLGLFRGDKQRVILVWEERLFGFTDTGGLGQIRYDPKLAGAHEAVVKHIGQRIADVTLRPDAAD